MARSEKFKRSDLVPVLKEGFRQLKEYRNNVDETRTEQNYTYGCQTWKEAISKAKARESEIMDGKINKQSKPLFSWVVPYPKGRTSVSEHDFFEAVRDYMDIHYGVDNVIAVCVHMDETTPHCHCYIVPETISRKNGKRTVSVGSLLDKKGLIEFHKKCNDYMLDRFKEPNMIKLPEEEKAKENVSMMELKRRTLKAENETLTAGNKELETQRRELTNSVSTLENELRMLEEKRKEEIERSKMLVDAKISDYQQKKVKELKQYLDRSQTRIEAEISDYRDKRVKEIEKELEPLEARKKRVKEDIKQMVTENWDKYEAFSQYQHWSEMADKAKQAFERFRNWMTEWQLFKVKKEHENYHAKREKNDDWDLEM
jgi:hypothetical protein